MSHRHSFLLLAALGASLTLGCEEPKKEEPKKAAAAAKPAPAPTPEKEPEPPKEEEKKEEAKDDKPEQTPLEKCCTALARGGFTVQGPQRQNFMKGAAACREGVGKKQKLASVKGPIKKAMGSATIPPECL